MSKLRVLVTDADTPKSLAIVRALGDRHEVWTAATSCLALAAWSRHTHRHLTYPHPARVDLSEWLLDVCRRNGIQIVIPTEESSSLQIAHKSAGFGQHGITVASLPFDALDKVVDKTKTLEAAQSIGVRIPPTEIPAHTGDIVTAARRLGYPVVVKPRSTQYWNGHRYIPSPSIGYAISDAQLRPLLCRIDPNMPPPIVQQFIPGAGVGVSMLMDERGDVLAEFAHRRLRDYRPTGSGSVLRESIPLTADLRDSSARLLNQLGCSGIAMVEFRIDERSGEPYLMEINGRFWGSLQLAIDAGVNFPALLVDWLTGKPVVKPSYQPGVVLRWWVGDFIRTLRVLRGRPSGFTGSFPSRIAAIKEFLGPQPEGTRNEILRWRDCRPSLIEPLSVMRKLLA